MANTFKYWIPLSSINKSKDSAGNVVMKVGGIASTVRRDTDGESLDPAGFDTTYLQNNGILNYNHNKSPDAVIGEPTKVEKRKEGLYVECILYPDSALAKSVYELGEVLEKNSKTRRLGYSIEGKALTRDPFDQSKVTKAMITNLALTMSPKNPDSKVNLIKGMLFDSEDSIDTLEKSVDEMIDEVKTESAQARNGGTTQYIINIERPDGTTITVDDEYNVCVKKSLEANGNGAPLKKESLNSNLKDLQKISKSEILSEVLGSTTVISFEKAIEVSENIFQQIQNNMQTNGKKLTEDVLNKALSDLGIKPNNISKSNYSEDEEEDEEEIEKSDIENDEMKKSAKSDSKKDDKMYKDGAEEEDEEEDEEDEEGNMISKGLNNTLSKGGEGSRGGKIIGHTKSGKPIYESFSHPAHKDFTSKDHMEASNLHNKMWRNKEKNANSELSRSFYKDQDDSQGGKWDSGKHEIHPSGKIYDEAKKKYADHQIQNDRDHAGNADAHEEAANKADKYNPNEAKTDKQKKSEYESLNPKQQEKYDAHVERGASTSMTDDEGNTRHNEAMRHAKNSKLYKSIETEGDTLIKSMFDELGAKQSTQARALGTLMKGIMSQVGELRSELDSSKQELQEVRNELFKANDMIEEIGNQPSQRKTAVRAIDRTFEKGLTENAPSNSNVLNSKTQKQQVLTLLDNMSFEKGFNADLAKAMTVYEGSGFLESHIVDLIKKEKGVAIV